jgi:hypothetical protein
MVNNSTHVSTPSQTWSIEARQLVVQARVLSGDKLLELLCRLQRLTGQSKDDCWRFIRQHGLKRGVEHRRWSDVEFDQLREELAMHPISVVAKKLGRSEESIRSILARHGLSVRAIRCDLFSVQSLASALHVSRRQVLSWIEEGWLQATVEIRGNLRSLTITPEALTQLYRLHLPKLIQRGLPNRTLFEAYLEYCHVPKHTTGSQLLDVRRDKKEREAYELQYENEDDSFG